ncbi:hypothetical protein C0J52_02670 [Blattella germanica]|nr:hypothetical protein C0J52_02670 [Blattella germanica]
MADRGQLITQQRVKTVLLNAETKSVVLTQRRFRQNFNTRWAPVKKKSLDCIGSLKLMKCHNQSNHVCFKSDHLKMTVLHTLLGQHKEERPHWAPHSPDINPCDYFLWGFLKEQVFHQLPGDLLELRACIVQVCNTIDEDVPESSVEYECLS